LQTCRARLSAGHDQPIKRHTPQIGDIAISRAERLPHRFGARNIRDREQLEPHDHVTGRRAKEIDELPLGCFPCRVGHVVDEAYGQAIAAAQVDGRRRSRRIEQERHRACVPIYSAAIRGERRDCARPSA
jgi:hypothetical protein